MNWRLIQEDQLGDPGVELGGHIENVQCIEELVLTAAEVRLGGEGGRKGKEMKEGQKGKS